MSNFESGEEFAGTFLSHFGVKGMKWGRRMSEGTSAVKESGEVSEDASRARELTAKVKSGGTKALSNKEMRELVERMNLEQNFARINGPQANTKSPMKTGLEFVSKKGVKYSNMYVDSLVQMKMKEDINDRFGSPKKGD